MTDYVQVWTSTDGRGAADELARSAVEKRLAACAQVDGPIISVYQWQGDVRTAREWRVVFKTTAALSERLQAHLLDIHSYETPEVVAAAIIHGAPDYLAWISAETRHV